MGCCGKIGDMLSGIFDIVKKVLVVALLCAAVYFAFFGGSGALAIFSNFTFLPTFITTASASAATWAAVSLGTAILLDPDAVISVGGSLASGIGKVAGAVIAGAGAGVVSGLTGSNLSLMSMVAIGVGAWWLLGYFEKKRKTDAEAAERKLDREAQYGVPAVAAPSPTK